MYKSLSVLSTLFLNTGISSYLRLKIKIINVMMMLLFYLIFEKCAIGSTYCRQILKCNFNVSMEIVDRFVDRSVLSPFLLPFLPFAI